MGKSVKPQTHKQAFLPKSHYTRTGFDHQGLVQPWALEAKCLPKSKGVLIAWSVFVFKFKILKMVGPKTNKKRGRGWQKGSVFCSCLMFCLVVLCSFAVFGFFFGGGGDVFSFSSIASGKFRNWNHNWRLGTWEPTSLWSKNPPKGSMLIHSLGLAKLSAKLPPKPGGHVAVGNPKGGEPNRISL